MKYILAFLFTALIVKVQGQNRSYLLEGNIGEYPVVMDLQYDDSTCGAAYYYKSAKTDIQMRGYTLNAKLVLYASRWNSKIKRDDTFETIILKRGDKGTFTGTWENNKQKSLAVSLHPADIKSVNNPFARLPYVKELRTEDGYNYMRTAAMQLVEDSVVKYGKYTLEYVNIDHSEVRLFHVTEGCGKPVMDKINAILDNAMIEYAARSFSCAYYKFSIRHLFVTEGVISINLYEDYDCGGAHPDDGIEPININMKTGEELALEDVLYLAADAIPKPHSDEWLNYRHDLYAPKLIALLKELYPKQMEDKDEGQPCNYGQEYLWDYAAWYLTDKGLYLSPSFPHVVAICRDPSWSIIPYRVMKKYKNPKTEIALP